MKRQKLAFEEIRNRDCSKGMSYFFRCVLSAQRIFGSEHSRTDQNADEYEVRERRMTDDLETEQSGPGRGNRALADWSFFLKRTNRPIDCESQVESQVES